MPFVPYLSDNVLTKFRGKSSNLHTLIICWNVTQSFWSGQLLLPLENKSQNRTLYILGGFIKNSACTDFFLEDTYECLE